MDFIKVGQIVSTFGIKGEVKLNPLTDNINRFDNKGPYYIKNKDGNIEVNIENYRINKSQVIIKFEEFNNINEVIAFKDSFLLVLKEDRAELDPGDYYIDDLKNLKVIVDGRDFGIVEDILFTVANDVLLVSSNEKKYAIPLVKEFINNIDLKEKMIDINIIEGMEYDF